MGDPNTPTASSAQIKTSTIKIMPQIIILFFRLFTFLKTNSHSKPVPKSKTPAIRKSVMFHATSFVHCIAISGINKRVAAVNKITINLLFFIAFLVFNYKFFGFNLTAVLAVEKKGFFGQGCFQYAGIIVVQKNASIKNYPKFNQRYLHPGILSNLHQQVN